LEEEVVALLLVEAVVPQEEEVSQLVEVLVSLQPFQ